MKKVQTETLKTQAKISDNQGSGPTSEFMLEMLKFMNFLYAPYQSISL